MTNTRSFVLLAGCAVLLARAPFLAYNPDWGPMLDNEHCFLLADPYVHEQRRTLWPDEELPFWVVGYDHMKVHFHRGAEPLAHMVRWSSRLLPTPTVLPIKCVGIALTVLTAGLLAWGLGRIWPRRRTNVLVPLFLLAFPPSFLLWVTLLPRGHYFETYLFYGLFLPFMVSEAEERTRWYGLLLLGALGGIAAAYAFSNAIFFTAFLCLWCIEHVLFALPRGPRETVRGLWTWLRTVALASVPAVATYALLGDISWAFGRIGADNNKTWQILLGGGDVTEAVGRGAYPDQWWEPLAVSSRLLFGTTVETTRPDAWGLAMLTVAAVAVLLLGGMVYTLAGVLVALARGRDGIATREKRFLLLNGMLLAGFLMAFLAFEPFEWYLAPVYAPLFVGTGALVSRLSRSATSAVRVLGLVVTVAAGASLSLGWLDHLLWNARQRDVPDAGRCETLRLGGYFWELESGGRGRGGLLYGEPAPRVFDREEGQRRCSAVYPQDRGVCTYVGYLLALTQGERAVPCANAPQTERVLCAQAFGASRSPVHLAAAEAPHTGCSVFTGELLDACTSGAYQGVTTDSTDGYIAEMTSLCSESFADPGLRSACWEQIAALLYGAPLLPEPPDSPPPPCESWPAEWKGLCARAVTQASGTSVEGPRPDCESVYLERFAEQLPQAGRLQHSQCHHMTDTGLYPWCAIGIARQRGEVECGWSGSFGSEGPSL